MHTLCAHPLFTPSFYIWEVREARASSIRLRVCYEAFREDDGSTWEDWVDLPRVRPLPPAHDPGFLSTLRKGAPLEINFEEGWWEVAMDLSSTPTLRLPQRLCSSHPRRQPCLAFALPAQNTAPFSLLLR